VRIFSRVGLPKRTTEQNEEPQTTNDDTGLLTRSDTAVVWQANQSRDPKKPLKERIINPYNIWPNADK